MASGARVQQTHLSAVEPACLVLLAGVVGTASPISNGHRSFSGIDLVHQPSQSPDLNVNDLGFYASLDRAVGKLRSFNIEELWEQVKKAYNNYPKDKLMKLFHLRAKVYGLVVEAKGGNDYLLPHGAKAPRHRKSC